MSELPKNSGQSQRTVARGKLLKLLADQALSSDFVSAVVGDRKMTPEEERQFMQLKEQRGDRMFSDLLFALCHQYFPSGKAKAIWTELLEHRDTMVEQLGRKVGIAVAALDYLTTIEPIIDNPVIISGTSMATVAEVAIRDGLTRLYDHSTLLTKLDAEVRRFERYGHGISIIMLDLDHFKNLNDTHGHQQGDEVLMAVSKIIQNDLRSVDIAARYGGEEFAIVLPQTPVEHAFSFAERLREHIQNRFAHDYKVTVSAGVAACPHDSTKTAGLIHAADVALYHSKQNGRNQTTRYSEIKES